MRRFLEAKKLRQRDVEGLNMNKPMTDTVETRDLYLASLWYAKGIKLLDVRRDGSQCWFVFDNKSECLTIQQRYYAQEESVIAKLYADAVRTLKELLFR